MQKNNEPPADKPKSMCIDMPIWGDPIQVDDFIVAVSERQSNSVYHVCEIISEKPNIEKRLRRIRYKAYKSDLLTALRRDPEQKLIPMTWYKREKKKA